MEYVIRWVILVFLGYLYGFVGNGLMGMFSLWGCEGIWNVTVSRFKSSILSISEHAYQDVQK